jgi:prepilin-type N-terminal cleavage/methylation domain-containing protein
MKKKNLARGFTLIELLISMLVVVLIGSIITSILFSVLRGTNKTNKLIIIRQNGNYAISQLSKTIRNAKAIVTPCDTNPVSTITITAQDDTDLVLACENNNVTMTSGANKTNLVDTSAVAIKSGIANCSFACIQGATTQLVSVSFTVQQAKADALNENSASLIFETAIAMRNIE